MIKIKLYPEANIYYGSKNLKPSNYYAATLSTSEVSIIKNTLATYKNNQIEEGDIVCFGKDNITRDKVKELASRVNFKRVTDKTKANTLVIDDIKFNNAMNSSTSGNQSLVSYNVVTGKPNFSINKNTLNTDVFELKQDYLTGDKNPSSIISIESYVVLEHIWQYRVDRILHVLADKYFEILNLVNNGCDKYKIVLASQLQKQFNEDNIELNEDTYETLRTMFSSEDTANTALAMEVLSNAFIPDESRVYVLLLLYSNYHKIVQIEKTTTINKFLKIYNKEYKLGRDTIQNVYKYMLDNYTPSIVKPLMEKLLVDYMNKTFNFDKIKVQTLSLS
jgi:hypothetical protein